MVDTSTVTGVTTSQNAITTIEDLAPNNYLTIVWKSPTTQNTYNTFDEMSETAKQYTTELNNAINNALSSTNKYSAQLKNVNLEGIAKYITQNTIDDSTQRRVVNGLIGLISKSGTETLKNKDDITNLMVNIFGNIANQVADKVGVSDPHEVFANLMNENNLKVLCDKTSGFINNIKTKFSKTQTADTVTSTNSNSTKTYVGLLLGLTTSDTETIDITIPRRKVESGTNYTTHLLPEPFKKDFEVVLTNKVLSDNYSRITEITNIEKTKDKLLEIANSRTPFDIYIKLSNSNMYKRSQVVFSNISVSKSPDGGNGYTASFSVEPIENFITKTFISNKKFVAKLKPSSSASNTQSGSSSGTGKFRTGTGSGSKDRSKNPGKTPPTNNGKSIDYYYANKNDIYTAPSLDALKRYCKENNLAILQFKKKYGGVWYRVVSKNSISKIAGEEGTGYAYNGFIGMISSARPLKDGWTRSSNKLIPIYRVIIP